MGHARRDEGTSGDTTTPRRAAITGLAGLAALGAAAIAPGAAKGKKKGKTSGTLVKIEVVQSTGVIPANSTDSELALCPEPGAKQDVYVLGGGFSTDHVTLVLRGAMSVEGPDDEVGYSVTVENTDLGSPHNLTAQAICGYFQK